MATKLTKPQDAMIDWLAGRAQQGQDEWAYMSGKPKIFEHLTSVGLVETEFVDKRYRRHRLTDAGRLYATERGWLTTPAEAAQPEPASAGDVGAVKRPMLGDTLQTIEQLDARIQELQKLMDATEYDAPAYLEYEHMLFKLQLMLERRRNQTERDSLKAALEELQVRAAEYLDTHTNAHHYATESGLGEEETERMQARSERNLEEVLRKQGWTVEDSQYYQQDIYNATWRVRFGKGSEYPRKLDY